MFRACGGSTRGAPSTHGAGKDMTPRSGVKDLPESAWERPASQRAADALSWNMIRLLEGLLSYSLRLRLTRSQQVKRRRPRPHAALRKCHPRTRPEIKDKDSGYKTEPAFATVRRGRPDWIQDQVGGRVKRRRKSRRHSSRMPTRGRQIPGRQGVLPSRAWSTTSSMV